MANITVNIDAADALLITEKADAANIVGTIATAASITPDITSIANAVTDGAGQSIVKNPPAASTVRLANKLIVTNR